MMLMRSGATHQLARRFDAGTLTLGEAFAFMSGLYFRGKLAYATTFAERGRPSTFVITPTRGLQPPDLIITRALIDEFAGVDVSQDHERYRRPLLADARRLEGAIAPHERIVLLGSGATAKYLGVPVRVSRQRRHREVPRRAVRGLRRSPVVSVGLRGSRRHEPWRADAACRRRGRRARIRRADRSDAPARTPAPASHASPIIPD